METNSAAPALRAICTRSASGTKVSSVRVISTRYFPDFSMRSRRRWAKSRTMSFSCSPPGALVPVSMPPWPGSSTTSGRGSPPFVCGRPALGASGRVSRLSSAILRKKLSRSVAHELEHQPRRRTVRCVHDERLVDAHRLGEIEDDARAALHHQPEAERLDQAASALAGFRRQARKVTCGMSRTTR